MVTAFLLGLAYGTGVVLVGGFVFGCGAVYGAMRERRKWTMTPPINGRMHFKDGNVGHYHVSDPDAAIAQLLSVSKR